MPPTALYTRRVSSGHKWVVLGCLMCGLWAVPSVHAGDVPNLPAAGLVVGPSVAWARVADANRLMLGADITGHLVMLWGSLGTRATVDGPRFIAPYAEAGAWLFANVGVGYSLAIQPSGTTHLVHGFLGVPLPIEFDELRSLVGLARLHNYGTNAGLVLEPYYRPSFRVAGSPSSVVHEAGVLVKYWLYDH